MGKTVSVWREREIRSGFWWQNLKERDTLEELGVVGRITLKSYSEDSRMKGPVLDSFRSG